MVLWLLLMGAAFGKFVQPPESTDGNFFPDQGELHWKDAPETQIPLRVNRPLSYDDRLEVADYAYCHGDPVNKVDVLGLLPWKFGLGDDNGVPYTVYEGLGGDPLAYTSDSFEAEVAGVAHSFASAMISDWHANVGPLSSPDLLNSSATNFYSAFEEHRGHTLAVSRLENQFYQTDGVGMLYGAVNSLNSIERRGSALFGETNPLAPAAYYNSGLEGVESMEAWVGFVGNMLVQSVPGVGVPQTISEYEAGQIGGLAAFGLVSLETLPLSGIAGDGFRMARTAGRTSVLGPKVVSNDLLATPGRLQGKLAAWRRYDGDMNLSQWSKSYDVLQKNRLRGKWRETFGSPGATYDTPFGRRIVDNAPAIEIKSGYASRTKFIRRQILKDSWLRRNVPGYTPFWKFVDQVPSQPLRQHLDTFNIPYQIPGGR